MTNKELYAKLINHIFEQRENNGDEWMLIENAFTRMLSEYERDDKDSERFFPLAKNYVSEYHLKIAVIEAINYLMDNGVIKLDKNIDLNGHLQNEIMLNNLNMMFWN